MKPFPAVMRENWRSIAFSLHSQRPLDEKTLQYSLNKAMLDAWGEEGYTKANFSLAEFAGGKGMVRCDSRMVDEVLLALTLFTGTPEARAWVEVLKVSGTMKKARK
jgi:RNase P/RNase MRP subunit POP5